jgi:Tol biopolymer transport system component
MKKLIAVILILTLAGSLAACGSVNIKKDITTLPKIQDKKEILEVQEVQELHKGISWDISSDGKQLLFTWDENKADKNSEDELAPPSQLYIMNLPGKDIKKLSSSKINQTFATFSPDGSRIAFMETVEESMRLYSMENKEGAAKVEIAGLGIEHSYAWSPNGKEIAIKYGMGRDKIIIYDQKKNEKNIISDKDVEYMNHPYYYDEETLLYVINNRVVAKDLTVQDRVKKVVDGIDFEISNDKQRIAYFTKPDIEGTGTKTLNVAAIGKNLDLGSAILNMTVPMDSKILWAPDSKYLLYTDSGNIWAVNPQNQEKKQIASNVGYIITVLWENEKEIVYSSIPSEIKEGTNNAASIYQINLK